MTCELRDEESQCISQCHASRGDGECIWRFCPQLLAAKGHCRLDFVCQTHGPVIGHEIGHEAPPVTQSPPVSETNPSPFMSAI